jgi:hypothetical protein
MGEGEAMNYRTLTPTRSLVLRFWHNEVLLDIEGVLERIAEALADPHPSRLPEKEREKGGARPGRGQGEGR